MHGDDENAEKEGQSLKSIVLAQYENRNIKV
jgi:hypothetical protein